MLELFRRYQRYLYIVITVVIVISFSFFGTYSTLSDSSFREQIAFTAVNGREVTRHELDEMVSFISTDSLDKLLFGGAWGPNFLNNGVIRQDFLETGLGAMLIEQYPNELQSELETRLEKEQRFNLYSHPEAKFIGVESTWTNFSPAMKTNFDALTKSENPLERGVINARIALFLGEKQFPSQLLRQLIRYQEKQYSGIKPDQNLDYTDLSLFNYHTLEDWFGPRFIRLVSQYIINAAAIAEEKGYQVSKADALADLARNSEMSFQQNSRNANLDVTSSQEYFNEQLRRLGMDTNKAAKLWRQVLLFQRYFQDMGSSVFVDPNTFARLNSYALEGVEGELYRLPTPLHLNNFASMQEFEVYLDAISKRERSGNELLAMPSKVLSVEEISKSTPELVQKRYTLEVASVDKKTLQAKVGVKESWNWEVETKNWEILKKQFPELGLKKADTREARFAALDTLDAKTRGRVDAFARASIVETQPTWLTQALKDATTKKMTLGLHEKTGSDHFVGLKVGSELMNLLDVAPLATQETKTFSNTQKSAMEKLSSFTADSHTYYRIAVIERSPKQEVMTFAEASQEGILETLLNKKLEAYYLKTRESNSSDYLRADKSYKPFNEVKEQVAKQYFEPQLKAIRTSYAAAIAPEKAPQEMIADFAATLRFYPYMQGVLAKLQKDPTSASLFVGNPTQPAVNDSLVSERPAIVDQWKLEKNAYKTTRAGTNDLLDHAELFSLTDNSFTKVNHPASGDINFFYLERKVSEPDRKAILGNVSKARQLLSSDAQQKLMMLTLKEIKDKHAISLEYMTQPEGMPESVEESAVVNVNSP